MNLNYFISSRLTTHKQAGFSKLIVRIAIAAVAISIAVMILAVAISNGYQREIKNKVSGFHSHIQISAPTQDHSYENKPIVHDSVFYKKAASLSGVKHIQKFANKAGIIKTNEDFQGIVLKGIDENFDWSFVEANTKEGKKFSVNADFNSDKIFISRSIAQKLKFKIGENFFVYFIQDPMRVRKFVISGIFDSGLDDFDNLYAFVDIKHIQKLNNWQPNQINGYEIFVDDFETIDKEIGLIQNILPYSLNIQSINEMYPALFDWLKMLDMNVVIVLILMLIVAAINMITALMILILERSNMIGILKSLGESDSNIVKIFLYMASFIILRGLVIGNILGFGLGFLQKYTGIISLPEEEYYLNRVPIQFDWIDFAWINLGSFLICILILLIPSSFVSRISPAKTIKFD